MYDRRMLEALAEAVTELVVAPSVEQIEKALWLRERLDAKISRALRDFDEAEGWRQDGSLSLTAWLAAHGRASRKEAHREAVIASRLASLPVTEGAWADGTLSSGQTAAIVANVCAERAALYAEHEAEMTPVLAELSVAETAVAMRSWRLHAEAQEDGRHPAEHPSALHLSQTLDGRRELVGHLAAVDAAIVEAAIAQAMGDRSTRPIPAEGPCPRRPKGAPRLSSTCADGFWTTTTRRLRAPDNVHTFPSLCAFRTWPPVRLDNSRTAPLSQGPPFPSSPATPSYTASSCPGGQPFWTTARRSAPSVRRCGLLW